MNKYLALAGAFAAVVAVAPNALAQQTVTTASGGIYVVPSMGFGLTQSFANSAYNAYTQFTDATVTQGVRTQFTDPTLRTDSRTEFTDASVTQGAHVNFVDPTIRGFQ